MSSTHQVVDMLLADGRELRASPGHPTTDGRLLGQLRPGDIVDGAAAVRADLQTYSGGQTYDLLPSGEPGFYIAHGVPLASTLRRPAAAPAPPSRARRAVLPCQLRDVRPACYSLFRRCCG